MQTLQRERPGRRHAAFLVHYLVLLFSAEFLVAFAGPSGQGALVLGGLLIDVFLVVSLPVEASLLASKDPPLAAFLGALVLPPLLRVVTLSTPMTPFSTVQWLAIVSVPLLLATFAVMRALGLRPRDVFLSLGERRFTGLNILLVASGLSIGFVEYQILHVTPSMSGTSSGDFAFAAFALFLATGLAEELIFRGVLLRTGIPLLGRRGAVGYSAIIFAGLHVGFMSVPDLLLAFVVGLAFGVVVLVSQTLWGAVGAHTLANVALYLIFPLGI